MTLNRSHRRAKPRWLTLAVVAGALLLTSGGLVYGAIFGAPGDSPHVFELDGNPTDPTPPGAGNRNLPDDWSAIFPTPAAPTGFLDKSFTDDHASIDKTYFTGGSSKDDIDIDTTATGGGWLYDESFSAQAKADIIDAFAASYLVNDKTVVYFGMDRFSNDGATFAGFWFLQQGITLGTPAKNGVGEIRGNHVPGDILVITDFTQGGAVEKLNVYEWVGPGNGSINGVFNLKFSGTDCATAVATDLACSKVNSTEIDSPWPFVPKSNIGPANKFQPGLFIEGGINISDLFPGEDPCFTNFVAETRASFSVDSTLSDFTFGNFNTCGGIEALKYHDKNADGDRDSGEEVLSGWTIFIDGDNDGALDAGETSGTTGADGKVTFSNLTSGTYRVCEVLQANWLNSDPGASPPCQNVTVGIGGAVQQIDFGNYQNVNVKVIKYHDQNADGSKQATEPFLENWQFYEERGANEVRDGLVDGALQSTNTNGETTFSFAPGASYKVCEVLQANWINSDPSGTTICESTGTLVSGTAAGDLVFGNFQNATISGIKWHDINGNGTREANGADNTANTADDEVLLQGWEIHLFGTDGTGAAVHTHATTNASGAYSFTVAPGSYTICETQQSTWAQTYPTTATTGSAACTHVAGGGGTGAGSGRGWLVTAVSGQSYTGNDFGNRRLFRLLVLTCSEATGQLIASTVDLDGNSATTGDRKETIIANPTGVTGDLCTLGGAQYNDLPAGTYTPDVVIPKP